MLSRPLFFVLSLIFRFFLFQHIVYNKFKRKHQRVCLFFGQSGDYRFPRDLYFVVYRLSFSHDKMINQRACKAWVSQPHLFRIERSSFPYVKVISADFLCLSFGVWYQKKPFSSRAENIAETIEWTVMNAIFFACSLTPPSFPDFSFLSKDK